MWQATVIRFDVWADLWDQYLMSENTYMGCSRKCWNGLILGLSGPVFQKDLKWSHLGQEGFSVVKARWPTTRFNSELSESALTELNLQGGSCSKTLEKQNTRVIWVQWMVKCCKSSYTQSSNGWEALKGGERKTSFQNSIPLGFSQLIQRAGNEGVCCPVWCCQYSKAWIFSESWKWFLQFLLVPCILLQLTSHPKASVY